MFIIIGASSFIGVYTATHFIEQGEKIVVTGRNNKFKEYYDSLGAEYINLDLTKPEDFEKLPKEGVKGVILIAGALPASENADLKEKENADQKCRIRYCRILQPAARNEKRMVQIASCLWCWPSWLSKS